MSSRARKILEEAYALSPSERAMLALELARTVEEDPAQVEAAWTAEAVRRLEAVERGEVEAVDLAEVRDQVRRALRKR